MSSLMDWILEQGGGRESIMYYNNTRPRTISAKYARRCGAKKEIKKKKEKEIEEEKKRE